MKLSPIEQVAYTFLSPLPRLQGLLLGQLRRGHEEYGGPIDDCGYSAQKLIAEGGQELADFSMYASAYCQQAGSKMPQDVALALLRVGRWVETEMEAQE